jgi:hypothetical protein
MSDDNFEKVEPVLPEDMKMSYEDPNEYFIYRPDTDVVKLSMGIHGSGVPFEVVEFEGTRFYEIQNELWQRADVGVDALGVYVVFYRMKKEFKGYGV